MNPNGNITPINQKTPQNSRKKKRNNDSHDSDEVMQKALHVLNEQEDQYDVFGKYIATELKNLQSEYLRKKLKRKIQLAILEISEEEERVAAVNTGGYTNPGSVGSYSSHITDTSVYSNPEPMSSYSGHTNLSTNTLIRKDSEQPFSLLLHSAAQYLHTETESSCNTNM